MVGLLFGALQQIFFFFFKKDGKTVNGIEIRIEILIARGKKSKGFFERTILQQL